MSDDEQILTELGRMSRLLALVAVRGLDKKEVAPLLARAGYNFVEAGERLGISRNAAQLIVQRAKKGGAMTRKRGKK